LSVHLTLATYGEILTSMCWPHTRPPYSKLINKSVPNTVDLRALSSVPSRRGPRRHEALQENMTLVIESGRAIGCRVNDDTGDKIMSGDPETINSFLLDLIRVSPSP